MNETKSELPACYRTAARVLLKFAIVMAILGLLSGVAYQESSKKLGYDDPGFRIQATIRLALVHGHVLLLGTILPLLLAGMMFLARKVGGMDLGPKAIRSLTLGYLPFAAGSIALMLYKGYHFLRPGRDRRELLRGRDDDPALGVRTVPHVHGGRPDRVPRRDLEEP